MRRRDLGGSNNNNNSSSDGVLNGSSSHRRYSSVLVVVLSLSRTNTAFSLRATRRGSTSSWRGSNSSCRQPELVGYMTAGATPCISSRNHPLRLVRYTIALGAAGTATTAKNAPHPAGSRVRAAPVVSTAICGGTAPCIFMAAAARMTAVSSAVAAGWASMAAAAAWTSVEARSYSSRWW